MKKVTRIIILILIALALVSCDGAVDKLLLHEYTVTYNAGSGVGEARSETTTNCYHNILANSTLETSDRAIDDSKDVTGFTKQDYSFYGWIDEEGNYYHHSNDATQNNIKLKKDLVLEALWINNLTGEIVRKEHQDYVAITGYTGSQGTLIIPEVYTIWNGTQNTDYLVTQIGNGTDSIATSTLKDVILPESIKTIKENAFTSCTNLTNVEIKSTKLTSVGTNAFPDKQDLKIEVPASKVEDYKNICPAISSKIEKRAENKETKITIPSTIDVTGITLNKTSADIYIDKPETLSATIAPTNATTKTVKWSSSDNSIATVDEDTGEVTGVAPGTATITATTDDGNKTATCEVRVGGYNNCVTFSSSSPFTVQFYDDLQDDPSNSLNFILF